MLDYSEIKGQNYPAKKLNFAKLQTCASVAFWGLMSFLTRSATPTGLPGSCFEFSSISTCPHQCSQLCCVNTGLFSVWNSANYILQSIKSRRLWRFLFNKCNSLCSLCSATLHFIYIWVSWCSDIVGTCVNMDLHVTRVTVSHVFLLSVQPYQPENRAFCNWYTQWSLPVNDNEKNWCLQLLHWTHNLCVVYLYCVV